MGFDIEVLLSGSVKKCFELGLMPEPHMTYNVKIVYFYTQDWHNGSHMIDRDIFQKKKYRITNLSERLEIWSDTWFCYQDLRAKI